MRLGSAGSTKGPRLFREDAGQTLVVVALATTVLVGALALGLDWGYGLTQRRVMQNAAEAGTLAAAKLLAKSVLAVPGPGNSTTYLFSASKELTYCEAWKYADNNSGFGLGAPSVAIEFGTVSNVNQPATWDPPTWQAPFAINPATCPNPVTSTAVDPSTRFVRVHSSTSYRSLFASVIGQPTLTAGAQARARLTGTPVPLTGPTWPMVRHYEPGDFQNDCGNPCNPTTVAPVPFWCTAGPSCGASVYGNFKAAIDFSRYSNAYINAGTNNVGQLLRAWDQTGTHPDHSANGQNCPGTWNASGNNGDPNACDVPNWFYYSFGGTLALDTAWTASCPPLSPPTCKPLPVGQAPLIDIGTRTSCATLPSYVSAPSCGAGNHLLGDWVEVTGGNIGSNFSSVLRDRIQDQGSLTQFSSLPYPNARQPCVDPGGPSESNCYGKALTMLIFLWDCAEDFNGGAWGLLVDVHGNTESECDELNQTGNKIRGTNNNGDVNRVHLFTAAPFTFYKGLVNTSSVSGFWGGAWGAASSCPQCVLNPLSNSAYLDGD